jgi:hypothetical protein
VLISFISEMSDNLKMEAGMNGTGVFAIEMLASLAISAVIVLKLQSLLRRIGTETCSRPGSTEFWIAYTQLMMIIAPLVLLAFFSRAGSVPALSETAQVQNSLLVVLTGQFIGLALVGRAVWKAMLGPRSDVKAPASIINPGGGS